VGVVTANQMAFLVDGGPPLYATRQRLHLTKGGRGQKDMKKKGGALVVVCAKSVKLLVACDEGKIVTLSRGGAITHSTSTFSGAA
jgi:hypothetical protein